MKKRSFHVYIYIYIHINSFIHHTLEAQNCDPEKLPYCDCVT